MRDGDGTGSRDGRPCRECACRGANRERGLRGRGQGVHAVIGTERCETNVEREPWRARLWIAWVAGCTRRRPGKQALAFCQVSRVFIISRLFAGSANPRMHDLLSAARVDRKAKCRSRTRCRPAAHRHTRVDSLTHHVLRHGYPAVRRQCASHWRPQRGTHRARPCCPHDRPRGGFERRTSHRPSR